MIDISAALGPRDTSQRNGPDAPRDGLPFQDAGIANLVLWLDAVMTQKGIVEGLSLRAVIIRLMQ
ncbi:hypothetical protein [Sulfitobacter guttiformis]|uniref:Uncharacterized protein n=1 Tax=Sulfitobacter guttiformis TaxID=74349 RepID=A0A420DUB9_9RHOB|nr:hypothetical protein [Sulfitobacter guttiformis]KIN71478.1 hypothetical protein Z949_639 [Sulfitobacter guttiformis KCTC 32187]RKE97911.1 hypothetical protein C8N30_2547 [Sulfitobacter guttiformis]